jgi:hypothetical protein
LKKHFQKFEKLREANPKSTFSPSDQKFLTWNLYHEARGEKRLGKLGKLGVLLSVLERMQSNSHPSSVPGVIFKIRQYSWTPKILEETHQTKISDYLEIRELVENFTGGGITFEKALSEVRKATRAEYAKIYPGKILPDGLVNYQRLDTLENPRFSVDVKAKPTRMRIEIINHILKTKDPKYYKYVAQFENHVHYTDFLSDPATMEKIYNEFFPIQTQIQN